MSINLFANALVADGGGTAKKLPVKKPKSTRATATPPPVATVQKVNSSLPASVQRQIQRASVPTLVSSSSAPNQTVISSKNIVGMGNLNLPEQAPIDPNTPQVGVSGSEPSAFVKDIIQNEQMKKMAQNAQSLSGYQEPAFVTDAKTKQRLAEEAEATQKWVDETREERRRDDASKAAAERAGIATTISGGIVIQDGKTFRQDRDTFIPGMGDLNIPDQPELEELPTLSEETEASQTIKDIIVGDTLPRNPVEGQLWKSSKDNITRVYKDGGWKISSEQKTVYKDPNTGQTVSTTMPSGAKEGDTWTDEAGYTRTFKDGRWKITKYNDQKVTTKDAKIVEDSTVVTDKEIPDELLSVDDTGLETTKTDIDTSTLFDERQEEFETPTTETPEVETPTTETPTTETPVVETEEVPVEEEVITVTDPNTGETTTTTGGEIIQTTLSSLESSSPGFMYSWDQQAYDETAAEYGVKVAEAVKNAVMARNQLAAQRADAMNQFYGGQYSSASKIEKFGWTGGAQSDEKMRMAYLNASINSQMYNQKEMILAGYDSELSVAREYANAQLTKLANEKYQQAQANAIGLAEVTGRYMSPEAKDVLSNLFMAQANPTDPKNAEIISKANQWIAAQGLTQEEFGQMQDYFKSHIAYGNTIGAMQWEEALRTANEKTVYRSWGEPGQTPYDYSISEWSSLLALKEREGFEWDDESETFVAKQSGGGTDDDNQDDDEGGSGGGGGGSITINQGSIINNESNIIPPTANEDHEGQLQITGDAGNKITLGELDKNGNVLRNGLNTGFRLQDDGSIKRIGFKKEAKSSDAQALINDFNKDRSSILKWKTPELQSIMSLDPTSLEPHLSNSGVLIGYKIPRDITGKLTSRITLEQYDYLLKNWWGKE